MKTIIIIAEITFIVSLWWMKNTNDRYVSPVVDQTEISAAGPQIQCVAYKQVSGKAVCYRWEIK